MLLHLDFSMETPIYQQIRNQIVCFIASGDLATIRALAEECGINMMTVSKAYALLKQEGYIQTDRRAGTVVSVRKPDTLPDHTREALELAVSEAKAAGTDLETVLALCKKIYG